MPIIANGKYYVVKANGKYYDIVNPFAMYTLTIVPTPADATVTLTASGYTQVGNTIKVQKGTTVNWQVRKTNYYTQTGSITVNSDTTQAVSLVYALATFTINPTPSDATVTLTATGYTQVGKSITVEKGTSVSWSVSKSGYITRTGSKQVNANESLNIELEVEGPLYYCYRHSVYGDTFYYFAQQPTQLGSYTCYGSFSGKATSSSDFNITLDVNIIEIGSNFIRPDWSYGVTFLRDSSGDLYT